MAELDREHLLALLQRLGAGDDAEVLAAARTLTERMTEAGFTWDEVIVDFENIEDEDDEDDEGAVEDDDEEDEDDDEEDEHEHEHEDDDELEAEHDGGEEDESEPERAENDGEEDEDEDDEDGLPAASPASSEPSKGDVSREEALIERLLTRENLSTSAREDLEAMRDDIRSGEFSEMDRSYLHALQRRLKGAKK